MSEIIKILCVEDEIEIRDNMVGILENEGFKVFTASNGKEGLEVFLENHPDIIISDIMMPESNGYDLLKSIRENKEIDNNNVPFILLSALGQKDDIMTGINLSASDYLVKPVDFDLLIAKIREKTSNALKTKEHHKKKIENLKTQVSNIVPEDMMQYVDIINKISSALKSEIYGPLPHKKYLEDLNKIYLYSLRLKTTINNFLSGSAISNQIDVDDEIINPCSLIKKFTSGINEKFKSKITINEQNANELPNIKINKNITYDVIKKIFGCIFKIDNDTNINISMATDHLGRMIIIFTSTKPIDENILREHLDKTIKSDVLDEQGLIMEVIFSNKHTNTILSIPSYRVTNKKQ
jgi:CheY-like chemotaxis protein